jgi:hypothetical protein
LSDEFAAGIEDDFGVLLRRARFRDVKANGGIKADAFRLRTARSERSLSFYDSRMTTPEAVLEAAPDASFIVVAIDTSALRQLGFVLESSPSSDRLLGRAHVLGTPPAVDEVGQIPAVTRDALARSANVIA